ncbi:MAG: ABC transporter permease, partial [Candidatus Aminicenantes bacterium]|nr:ABC transporter permease [Candidatus Aminicenantes bacterium]
MFKNYLFVALRHLKRFKAYSFINIMGLAIALACSFVIVLFIHDELSYDRFHLNAGRIYRVAMTITLQTRTLNSPTLQMALGPLLAASYPEVAEAVRFADEARTVVKHEDKEFYQSNILYADASIFRVFTFPLVRGNPQTALEKPSTTVLTETTARRYFGTTDPMGQVLRFNDERDFTVTGIVQDPPHNSSLRFDVLCSLESQFALNPRSRNDWIETNSHTYILLKPGQDYRQLEKKMEGIVAQRLGPVLKTVGGTARYFLHPLPKIHLYYPSYADDSSHAGNIASIYVFAAIAFLILGIACINFMNLATARSARRAKEIGIRKVAGAFRQDLVRQFLGESFISTLFASIVAVLLFIIALPALRSGLGIDLTFTPASAGRLTPLFAFLVLMVGLAAGSYPAFFLSSFHPADVLKGGLRSGRKNVRFRRILVGVQFIISIILIIVASLIREQLLFMKTKTLGFNKDQVLAMEIMDRQVFSSREVIKNRLKQVPGVLAVSAAQGVPGLGYFDNMPLVPEGFSFNESLIMTRFQADADYLPAMGIELAAGRNFSTENPSDSENSIIINETAVKELGWAEPLGKTIKIPVSPIRWQPKTVV